jgi:hypothetical protein
MSPQGIVFPSLEALYGEFQVLFHNRFYHDPWRESEKLKVRYKVNSEGKHRGTCLKEGFKSCKARQPSRKFQHSI